LRRLAEAMELEDGRIILYSLYFKHMSSVNTVLLVVVLVLLVGAGVWWYQTYGPGAPEQTGIQLNLGSTS
jgi:hypothetical protein